MPLCDFLPHCTSPTLQYYDYSSLSLPFYPGSESTFFADPDLQIYTDLDPDMAKTCGSETLFFYYHDNPTVTSENTSTIYFIYVHMPASFTFLARQRSPHR